MMTEWKKGDEVTVDWPGRLRLQGTIYSIDPDGWVRIEEEGGDVHSVPVKYLRGGLRIVRQATADVVQLAADPPAAIARVARNTKAKVLPSPVAEPTTKIFNPLFGDGE